MSSKPKNPTNSNQPHNQEIGKMILHNPIIALSIAILIAVFVIIVVYLFKRFQNKQSKESEVIANIMVPTLQVATMASTSRLHGPHTPLTCPVLKKFKEEGEGTDNKQARWGDWGN